MPRGDGTGPGGMGPMTGRAAGFCAGYSVPGFMNSYGGRLGGGFGWGRGRGFGMGRGARWGAYGAGIPFGAPAYGSVPYGTAPYGTVPYGPSYTPEQEMELLQNQAKALGDQLNEIQKRISEMESEVKKEKK